MSSPASGIYELAARIYELAARRLVWTLAPLVLERPSVSRRLPPYEETGFQYAERLYSYGIMARPYKTGLGIGPLAAITYVKIANPYTLEAGMEVWGSRTVERTARRWGLEPGVYGIAGRLYGRVTRRGCPSP